MLGCGGATKFEPQVIKIQNTTDHGWVGAKDF